MSAMNNYNSVFNLGALQQLADVALSHLTLPDPINNDSNPAAVNPEKVLVKAETTIRADSTDIEEKNIHSVKKMCNVTNNSSYIKEEVIHEEDITPDTINQEKVLVKEETNNREYYSDIEQKYTDSKQEESIQTNNFVTIKQEQLFVGEEVIHEEDITPVTINQEKVLLKEETTNRGDVSVIEENYTHSMQEESIETNKLVTIRQEQVFVKEEVIHEEDITSVTINQEKVLVKKETINRGDSSDIKEKYTHFMQEESNETNNLVTIKQEQVFVEVKSIHEEVKTENEERDALSSSEDSDETNISGNEKYCNICSKKCYTNKALVAHLKLHRTGKTCPTCCKPFKYLSLLVTHMERHTRRNPYVCTKCDTSFKTAGNLKNHIKSHAGHKHVCKECNKIFTNTSNLKVHMRVHTGEKPFVCNECNKGFSVAGNLQKHLQTHTNEKPYVCIECSKTFSQAIHLKQHYYIHTKEKSHACNICGKTFSRPKNLKNHMLVHAEEKPKGYVCNECKKSFSEAGNLKQHMRIHTGDNYPCPECDKTYTRSNTLKKHISIHTKEKSLHAKFVSKPSVRQVILNSLFRDGP